MTHVFEMLCLCSSKPFPNMLQTTQPRALQLLRKVIDWMFISVFCVELLMRMAPRCFDTKVCRDVRGKRYDSMSKS